LFGILRLKSLFLSRALGGIFGAAKSITAQEALLILPRECCGRETSHLNKRAKDFFFYPEGSIYQYGHSFLKR